MHQFKQQQKKAANRFGIMEFDATQFVNEQTQNLIHAHAAAMKLVLKPDFKLEACCCFGASRLSAADQAVLSETLERDYVISCECLRTVCDCVTDEKQGLMTIIEGWIRKRPDVPVLYRSEFLAEDMEMMERLHDHVRVGPIKCFLNWQVVPECWLDHKDTKYGYGYVCGESMRRLLQNMEEHPRLRSWLLSDDVFEGKTVRVAVPAKPEMVDWSTMREVMAGPWRVKNPSFGHVCNDCVLLTPKYNEDDEDCWECGWLLPGYWDFCNIAKVYQSKDSGIEVHADTLTQALRCIEIILR